MSGLTTLVHPPRPRAFPAGRPLLTSEQFLDWLKPGVHADLIGGKIVMHSPVNLRHARLVNFVDRLMGAYIEEQGLGELHRETVAVRLGVRDTFLPDLAYFTTEQVARLTPTHAPFAPTLVVEVVSPSSAKRDRADKFSAYETHGAQESWILDPEQLDHRFYRRTGDMLSEFADGADRIASFGLPGFWVKRAWLNAAQLPAVRACLAEILPAPRGRRR